LEEFPVKAFVRGIGKVAIEEVDDQKLEQINPALDFRS
jgi:hypothetical protein